jgi:hypothetical protein
VYVVSGGMSEHVARRVNLLPAAGGALIAGGAACVGSAWAARADAREVWEPAASGVQPEAAQGAPFRVTESAVAVVAPSFTGLPHPIWPPRLETSFLPWCQAKSTRSMLAGQRL